MSTYAFVTVLQAKGLISLHIYSEIRVTNYHVIINK